MRAELAKDNSHETNVCPGMMRTGSPFNAWFNGRHRDEFTWFVISDSIPGVSIHASRAAAGGQSVAALTEAGTEVTKPTDYVRSADLINDPDR